MFNSRDAVYLLAVSLAMITAGSVWLWGAVPLVILGVILLATTFVIDFRE